MTTDDKQYIVSKRLSDWQIEEWLNKYYAEGYELVTFGSFGKTHIAIMKLGCRRNP